MRTGLPVTSGTTALLRAQLTEHATQPLRRELATRLLVSTEILESTLGLYKQLERQHSQGGFTSLLAALPALLQPAAAWTPN